MSKILEEKSFFALNRAYRIRFPRVQRDYAQGRTKNAKVASVRTSFVLDLHKAVQGTPIKMDFIYGEVCQVSHETPTFLPLDGQQRLTTLFLLHWLLSPTPLCEELKGFVYESRRSAMAFCEGLQSYSFQSIVIASNECASNALKRQKWFRPIWEKDQTVRGMLVMLDELQRQMPMPPPGHDGWTNLCEMDMFQCLQTNSSESENEGDGLTDRIYLKMNARGLPLTPFEIIKSQIDVGLPGSFTLSPSWTLTKSQIQEKLDQQWLKFFFRARNSGFDSAMTQFFALHLYLASLTPTPEPDSDHEIAEKWTENSKILYKISENPSIFSSFEPFRLVLDRDPTLLTPLFRILEIVSTENETYPQAMTESLSWFMDAILPSWNKSSQGFDFLSPSNYAQRTVVYAAAIFPFNSPIPTPDERVRFKQWMRICWNLIQNSTVTSADQSPEEAVRLIQKLSPYAENIHSHLLSYQIPERTYARSQLLEEKLKVQWLTEPSKGISYNQLLTAESHYLLRGRISLLLEAPETFTSRYERFVDFMPKTENEFKEENSSNAEHRYTRQKALVTKLDRENFSKDRPLPTSNTPNAWRTIIIDHEKAMRLLLDDPADLDAMLNAPQEELWKQRMLNDTSLWEKGKDHRKGLAPIDSRIYLYTNKTNKTSAIPLDTSIPELWRKIFNKPSDEYPRLNDGDSFSVSLLTYAKLKQALPPNWVTSADGTLYFSPNQLIFRLRVGNTSSDFVIIDPYPSTESVESKTAEALWFEIMSACELHVEKWSTNNSTPPALT